MRTRETVTLKLEVTFQVEVDADHFATVRMTSESRQSVEDQINKQACEQLQEVSRTSQALRPVCWIAALPCEFTKRPL